MSDHAEPARKPVTARAAERAVPSASPNHDPLNHRPETKALAETERMLNARPALAAQRGATQALSQRCAVGSQPIQLATGAAQPLRQPIPRPAQGAQPIQRKKIAPAQVEGWTEPVEAGVTAAEADVPSMPNYDITYGDRLPNRDAAMNKMSLMHGAVGGQYTAHKLAQFNDKKLKGAVFLSKNTLAALMKEYGKGEKQNSPLYIKYQQAQAQGNVNVDEFLNEALLELVDPVKVILSASIGSEQAVENRLTVEVRFAESGSGYIVKVTDEKLGVNDTVIDQPEHLYGADAGPRVDVEGHFGSKHYPGGQSVKSAIEEMGGQKTLQVFEKGIDAICKFIAEGGRFIAVREVGTDLSDKTVFFTKVEGQDQYKGVSFRELYGQWAKTFGKEYNVSNEALRGRLVAPEDAVKKGVTFAAAEAAQHLTDDATHYNLDNGTKGAGLAAFQV